MIKYIFLLLLSCSFLHGIAQKKQARFYHSAPAAFVPVNDYAGLLTASQKSLLTNRLRQYRDSSGHTIVIITHGNLKDPQTNEDYSIEEAALHYFNKWRIGDTVRNDGVLIFIAKEERKARITTGKGLEEILGYTICQQIIDNDIVPNFKQQAYYEGFDAAVSSIDEALSPVAEYAKTDTPSFTNNDPYIAEEQTESAVGAGTIVSILGGIGVFIFSLVSLISGGSGGIYSGVGYNRYPRNNWWWGDRHYHHHHHHNSSHSGFDNSSGGADTSSDSGSSSSSFGGGSSNGGGASGSW